MNAKRKDKTVTVNHPYFANPGDPLLRTGGRLPTQTGPRLDWRQGLGGTFILGGFISLIAGYIGISGTKETYDQLTYFLSNGLGGACAIIIGSTILVIREHAVDRQAMRSIDELLCRLDDRIPADAGQRPAPRETAATYVRTPAAHNGATPTAQSVLKA